MWATGFIARIDAGNQTSSHKRCATLTPNLTILIREVTWPSMFEFLWNCICPTYISDIEFGVLIWLYQDYHQVYWTDEESCTERLLLYVVPLNMLLISTWFSLSLCVCVYLCARVCLCVYACIHMCGWQNTHVEIKKQLLGSCILLSPCRLWG